MYNSIAYHLYVALHVHHQSHIPFHYHIFDPLYPLLPPCHPLFPLNHHTVVCVYEGFLFVLFIHLLLLVLYLTYECHYMVLNFFWLILLRVILSKSIHVVANSSISPFLWLSSILSCVCVCVCVIYPITHLRYFRCFHILATVENFCNKHKGTYNFTNKYF